MAALVARQHRRDHPAYKFSLQHTRKEKRDKAAPTDVVERTQSAQDVRLPKSRKKGPRGKKRGGVPERASAVAGTSPTDMQPMMPFASTIVRHCVLADSTYRRCSHNRFLHRCKHQNR
ncbi:hypothetical protein IEO21_05758 [Rhodonia placenta]|uniref:Uncharacterized protein n=1 Tax=Rhodonia placenta TaxID=104341 RepID=A0A8H7P1D1_9APHY|nr:hypothetical protein IEO21_05758 [Postia placenta]